MCGIWRYANRLKELDTREWNRIAKILHRWHVGRVVITGGEPFIRPDIESIISDFSQQGFSITLLTNGTIATPDRFRKALRCGVHDVGISLDTLKPEKQDYIAQRTQVMPKILASIKTALDSIDGIVEVMITVSNWNIEEVPELIHFIDAMGAYAVVNPVNLAATSQHQTLLTAHTLSADGIGIAPELVDRIYDSIITLKKQGLHIMNSNKFLEASRNYLKGGGYSWQCDAGDLYFTVFADGSLAGCSDIQPVRNLARTGQYPNPRFIKNMIRTQRKQCPGCIYSCWREVSYLLHDWRTMTERLQNALTLSLNKRPRNEHTV